MQAPIQAGFACDSTIWVSDPGLFRLSWFHRDGTFLRSELARPVQIPGGPWRAQPRFVLQEGRILGITYAMDGQPGELFAVVLWGPEGEYEVLDWLTWGPDKGSTVINSQGVPLQVPRPFRGDPLVLSPAAGQGFSILDRSPADGPWGEMLIHRFSADAARRETEAAAQWFHQTILVNF